MYPHPILHTITAQQELKQNIFIKSCSLKFHISLLCQICLLTMIELWSIIRLTNNFSLSYSLSERNIPCEFASNFYLSPHWKTNISPVNSEQNARCSPVKRDLIFQFWDPDLRPKNLFKITLRTAHIAFPNFHNRTAAQGDFAVQTIFCALSSFASPRDYPNTTSNLMFLCLSYNLIECFS